MLAQGLFGASMMKEGDPVVLKRYQSVQENRWFDDEGRKLGGAPVLCEGENDAMSGGGLIWG
ncbi:GMC family oxidoreductase [Sesbania bispinosa]|nr:GMC family oxidoreductase [Sesbania bispinosa]